MSYFRQIVLALSFCLFTPKVYSAESDYLKFSSSKTWLNLLHMDKGKLSRIEKGSEYFLHPEGNKNPLKELVRSIEVFENPKLYLDKGRGHPHCLFPARLQILKKELGIKIKSVYCESFKKWEKQFKAQSVSVVYAGQFISNPASVMGHTFLKFNNYNEPEFMNMSVGYAADVAPDVGAFDYIYKGLFGGFRGSFLLFPFHKKYHEYSNIESREIWEYELSLTSEEVDLLLKHFWELKYNSQINYFFADENCSYMLLAAIQAIKPNVSLTQNFDLYVTPYETLLELQGKGIIVKESFEPSLTQKITERYKLLTAEEKKSVQTALDLLNLNGEESSESLDVVLDYLSFERHKYVGTLPKKMENFEKEVLIFRSKKSSKPKKIMMKKTSPLMAHKSKSIGIGYLNVNRNFETGVMSIKPGIHKLLENDAGFLENSSFNFFETDIFYDAKESEISLGRITLFDLRNSPEFFSLIPNYSWSVLVEHNQDLVNWCSSCSVRSVDLGFGVSYSLSQFLYLTAKMNLDYEWGEHLTQKQRLWGRPNLGIMTKIGSFAKIFNALSYGYNVSEANKDQYFSVSSHLRLFNIVKDIDLEASFDHHSFFTKRPDNNRFRVGLVWGI